MATRERLEGDVERAGPALGLGRDGAERRRPAARRRAVEVVRRVDREREAAVAVDGHGDRLAVGVVRVALAGRPSEADDERLPGREARAAEGEGIVLGARAGRDADVAGAGGRA